VLALFNREFDKTRLPRLAASSINCILEKPTERRGLMFTVAEILQNPFTAYTWENIGWAEPRFHVHAAKPAQLEKISEFGCVIRHSRPIANGTVLYLHGNIFENARNQHLIARFYYSEPHPSEKDQYLCYIMYFGIGDTFLKFIRSWIREKYAQSKQNQDT
jgi:hypothetical protein